MRSLNLRAGRWLAYGKIHKGEAAEVPGQPVFRTVLCVGRLIWRTSPWYVSALVILELVSGFFPILQLYLLKLVLNEVTAYLRTGTTRIFQSLILFVILQAASGAFASGIGLLMNRYRLLLNLMIENEASSEVLTHANRAPLARFEDSAFYDKLQRAAQASNGQAMDLLRHIFQAVRSLVTVLSYLLLLWALGWWVAPLLLVAALPGFIAQSRYERKLYEVTRTLTPLMRERSYLAYVLESDWLINEIKLFDIGPYFLRRFRELFSHAFAERKAVVNEGTWKSFLTQFLGMAGIVVVTIHVLHLTAAHQLTIGDFSMFTGAIVQFAGSLFTFAASAAGAYKASLLFGNVIEFTETSVHDNDENGKEEWEEEISRIEFQNVCYRYPSRDQDTLSDICFTVNRGEVVVFLGDNGSGKTTLTKLALHLYRPTSGRILLNGMDASRYSAQSIQRRMTAVFQNFAHYEMSARENITIGKPEQTTRDLDEVLRAAGAEEIVAQLPNSLETRLGTWFAGGVQLSTGQWQRLAIARALWRDGTVLVLDEPTSGADVQAEARLFQRLKDLASDRIVMVITHRMSLARLADRVIVLEGGRIIEEGTPEALLASGGWFSSRYTMEMARGTVEPLHL
ncbi:ABC transporter ATP-binding protein [Alicyclobacillus sendaiensis]|uniref:ABC transporter ATP-binding protein n=1 Tax=Alicyclobacillus sendaiensis TaxID=192387 RepID=UPI0026F46C62|nr:ABC transporter ATP-binding protein [Alicyclobacillus sendaiensis]